MHFFIFLGRVGSASVELENVAFRGQVLCESVTGSAVGTLLDAGVGLRPARRSRRLGRCAHCAVS